MKKFISLTLLAVVLLFAAVPVGKTKNKAYYSGDAINYNGQLVVVSANTESLEVFKLNGSELERVSRTRPFDARFNRYGAYYEVKLSEENGSLFVYAITDFKIDKYNISSLDANPALVTSLSNTYWEWYGGMEKIGNQYLTIGTKGVKLLNSDLQVTDSYNYKNTNPHNIQASENGRYLIDIQNGKVIVFDHQSRNIANEIALNYNKNEENRRAVMDAEGNIFVTDDFYAKEFSLDGTLKASFRHLDQPAYDTAVSDTNVYFTNGVGVVRLSKDNLKLLNHKYTSSYGGNGWAMGLKVVPSGQGDKVVVFNNSGILVLNQSLNKVAFFTGDTSEDEVFSTENLWLNINDASAPAGTTVTLSGGGFSPNEKAIIYFNGLGQQEARVDSQGRFKSDLQVPVVSGAPKTVDIKVVGDSSKLSYSLSFTVEK